MCGGSTAASGRELVVLAQMRYFDSICPEEPGGVVCSVCCDLQNFSGVVVDLHKSSLGKRDASTCAEGHHPLHDLNGRSSRSAQKSCEV